MLLKFPRDNVSPEVWLRTDFSRLGLGWGLIDSNKVLGDAQAAGHQIGFGGKKLWLSGVFAGVGAFKSSRFGFQS